MALNSPYIGHIVRETADKIVVFGEKTTDMTFQNQRSKLLEEMY